MTPKICPLLAIAAVSAGAKPTIEATDCLGVYCQWSVVGFDNDGYRTFKGCAVQFIGASTAP